MVSITHMYECVLFSRATSFYAMRHKWRKPAVEAATKSALLQATSSFTGPQLAHTWGRAGGDEVPCPTVHWKIVTERVRTLNLEIISPGL